MKFDLIISNPPYNANKHIEILKNAETIGDKLCFIMPITQSITRVNIPKRYDISTLLNSRLTILEFVSNNIFDNIALRSELGIIKCDVKNNGFINVYKDGVKKTVSSIDDINKYDNNHHFKSINSAYIKCKQEKLLYFANKDKLEYCLSLPNNRGNFNTSGWYTLVSKEISVHMKHTDHNFYFKTLDEVHNFYNYLKLKVIRFIYSLDKEVLGYNWNVPYMPDYTRPWSDEDIAKELGLTDEELAWAINWIPDYYPEDKEKYAKYKNF